MIRATWLARRIRRATTDCGGVPCVPCSRFIGRAAGLDRGGMRCAPSGCLRGQLRGPRLSCRRRGGDPRLQRVPRCRPLAYLRHDRRRRACQSRRNLRSSLNAVGLRREAPATRRRQRQSLRSTSRRNPKLRPVEDASTTSDEEQYGRRLCVPRLEPRASAVRACSRTEFNLDRERERGTQRGLRNAKLEPLPSKVRLAVRAMTTFDGAFHLDPVEGQPS